MYKISCLIFSYQLRKQQILLQRWRQVRRYERGIFKFLWKVKFIQLFGGKIWRKKDYLEVLVVDENFIQVNRKEMWSYGVYAADLVHDKDEERDWFFEKGNEICSSITFAELLDYLKYY